MTLKKILALVVCCLTIINTIAQRNKLDSVLKIYNAYHADDTIKLNLLLEISANYYYVNADSSRQIADEAIALAQKLSSEKKLTSAYRCKGDAYEGLGNYQSAMENYDKELLLAKKLNDSINIGISLKSIGVLYFNMADYSTALQYEKNALDIFERKNYDNGIAGAYNSLGVTYFTMSDFPKALENYLKSLTLFQKLKRNLEIATIYNNLGLVYSHLSDEKNTYLYLTKALKIYEELGDKGGQQRAWGNIGNYYDDIGNYSNALTAYQKSAEIAIAANQMAGVASAYVNMSGVYNELKNYPKALEHAKKALAAYQQNGNKIGTETCLLNIGQTYLALAGKDKKLLSDSALYYLQKAQTIGHEIKASEQESLVWKALSEAYQLQQNFPKALDAYKKFASLRDSALNNSKATEINSTITKFKLTILQDSLNTVEEKNAAVAASEISKQKVVRNAIAGGSATLLFASVFSFIFYKRRRDSRQKQQEAELRAEVSETEMKALRAQMNPHFIFNSLNSISDYISKNNLPQADDYLTKFAKLMRSVLENSEKKEVPLAEDLKTLELYIHLEQLRLNNKFTYEIKTDDDIDKENTLIPPLILQPFVENSIWHGIAKKNGSGKINIIIKKEGDMIKCTVDDDGVGLKENIQNFNHKSFGMKITNSRIDILNKTKNTNASVSLSKLNEGTRAELLLPLQLNF